MLRTIHLHGHLRKAFGREFRLDVETAREAIRALVLQLDGFRAALREGQYRVIRGTRRDGVDIADPHGIALSMRLGSASELHLVPVAKGAGGRSVAVGKIVAGALLVGLAIAVPFVAPIELGIGVGSASFGLSIAGVAISPTLIGGIGAALLLSGVASLLTKTPAPDHNTSSFIFSGQDNVTTQGGPVPLLYGKFLTGATLISAGLFAHQIAVGTDPFDPSRTPRVCTFTQVGAP